MDDFASSSRYFPCSPPDKERMERTGFRQYPRCNVSQLHDDGRPTDRRSAHYPLTSKSPSQLHDTITPTKWSHYHPKTKEILDRSYILRPASVLPPMNSKQSLGDPTLRVADAPHLRSVPHSRTKPRPISLFPIPHSESPLSPLIPSFRSPSRLSTSPDRLSRTDPQPPSPDIETAIGLPPKYTLQLNLPGDCSSLLILSEYGFGISDEDSDTRKVQDKSYSPASSSPTNTTASARRRSKDTLPSPIENSPGVASQAPHDPPPGQRLSSSYFNFDTDSSDSDATQIVVVHRRLTTSTNSSKTGKKRGSRPSTPRSIHPPARSSRNFIRSPYQPRRPNSRNSPSLHLRTSTQCSHSRQSSRQAHDVASILDSLSPARPLVPLPQKQYRQRHRRLPPALAALTPPSLFSPPATFSRNRAYTSSVKKRNPISPSSPTSSFYSNTGASIQVDISQVVSRTMYTPSHFQPAADPESPPFGITVNSVPLDVADQAHTPPAAAEHWPRTPFADTFQEEQEYLYNEGIMQGTNGVRKSERRQGWSGEWNQPCIEDVIQKLRTI